MTILTLSKHKNNLVDKSSYEPYMYVVCVHVCSIELINV